MSMPEFTRVYISNFHLSLLQTIQKQSGKFEEWELMNGANFSIKNSYGYTEGVSKYHESMLNAIAQNSIIAETKMPVKVKPSIFWNNALNIADVLTLLSIALVKYYAASAIEKSMKNRYTISWGIIPGHDFEIKGIIPLTDLGKYIEESIDIIEQNPQALEEKGIIPSIYWFNQAQISQYTAPSVLELSLYWMCIEVLAGVFNDTNNTKITNKKERVKKFVTEKGYAGKDWDFLDLVIDDWYMVRNSCFHEGKQTLTIPVLTLRRQQVRDFIHLVLLDMFLPRSGKRDKEISDRIRAYR